MKEIHLMCFDFIVIRNTCVSKILKHTFIPDMSIWFAWQLWTLTPYLHDSCCHDLGWFEATKLDIHIPLHCNVYSLYYFVFIKFCMDHLLASSLVEVQLHHYGLKSSLWWKSVWYLLILVLKPYPISPLSVLSHLLQGI